MKSRTRKAPEVDDFDYRRYEDLEKGDRRANNKPIKFTDADFDEDDLDFQGYIEKKLGKNSLVRITAMREKELEKMTEDNKLESYETFLDAQSNIYALAKLLKSGDLHLQSNYQDAPTMTSPELKTAVTAAGATIHTMLLKLVAIPHSADLNKKMQLLNDVANNIHDYYVNPQPELAVQMAENLQHLNHNKNAFWKPLKLALCAIVGTAFIAIGLLGIVPSFGASVGLIAAGAALCVYAGVKSFTHFLPQARQSLASNLSTILTHTNKLLASIEEIELNPVKPR
jgi:hypothetical protein